MTAPAPASVAAAAGLHARTVALDDDVDLATLAGDDGLLVEKGRTGIAGRGEALRVPWTGDPAVAAATAAATLVAIHSEDEIGAPGCGPVALGALPFLPGGHLVVPRLLVGRDVDGTRWCTTVVGPGEDHAAVRRSLLAPTSDAVTRSGSGGFQVESSLPVETWCAKVAAATAAIAAGELVKVVLAREVVVRTDQPIRGRDLIEHLRRAYPGCYVLSLDGLIGASPELLVSRHGDVVRAQPMAGTAPRGGDPATDQRLAASLLASAKDRAEHQITIDAVRDTLLPWCSYVDYEAEPSVVAVANVQHLATLVEGRLSRPAPSVLEPVAALHPTPAVAGWPRDAALAWIAANEDLDRRRYAGAAGWADANGNGTWAVAVRSAEIDEVGARVYAGVGVVAGSEPEAELAETRVKLQALLSAIVAP